MLKSIMTLWLAIGFMPILFVSAAGAMTLDFSCISNNDATNCATGEAQKPITVEEADFARGHAAISRDGDYISLVADDRLIVVKTTTGKRVAVMGTPVAGR